MAAQHVPPEGHDRGVTAGSGVFRMVDGVIWSKAGVNCVDGNRSPWRGSRATRDPKLAAEHGCGDHGAMACRGESVRMKISGP